jgi:NTE family protein
MNYDGVCEGGGTKIMGLVGGMAAIESRGFTPSNLAGTSAGAIVAAMRAAGYTPSEMRVLMDDLDFRKFKDKARWGTKSYHLIRHKGIYAGDFFYEYAKETLAAKGVSTFGDLKTSEADPRWRYKLKVIASDISQGRMITLPTDAVLYDIDPDKLEVALAIRMSMSIPGFFRPVIAKKSYIVDGGLLSNFPIWLFDADEAPSWPTFGLILREPHSMDPHKIRGTISYMMAIFKTMMKAHDRKVISGEDYFHRLIQIPTGEIGTMDFDLTSAQKEFLYYSGFNAGSEFIDNFSWPRYRKWASQQRGVTE